MSSIKRSDLDVAAYGTSYLTHAGRPHLLMSQVLLEVEEDDHVTATATILRRVIERQKLLTTME